MSLLSFASFVIGFGMSMSGFTVVGILYTSHIKIRFLDVLPFLLLALGGIGLMALVLLTNSGILK